MKLIKILLNLIKPSGTNTPGRNEGKGFDDLVASIKEKGVLTPILVRPKGKGYEVVAGHRRLEAAKLAGLTEIPAQVQDMNDIEAREAQIIENLHRQDIHPLDEGEAYRRLIEASKPRYEVKDVALKVGKSETYVRQRLALTNLTEKSAKAFRAGEITVSDAVLLSRVEDEKIQNEALKYFKEYGWEFERVRDWITNASYIKAIAKPNPLMLTADEKPNLFGDKTLGVDPVSFGQRMAAYIEKRIEDAKAKGQTMVKICTNYGKPEMKGVLAREQYKTLNSKEDKKEAREQIYGIVAEGDQLGQVVLMTTHPDDMKEAGPGGSTYKLSDKEKKQRKADALKAKKEKEKFQTDFQKAINKIKMPISDKHLDALVEFALNRCGYSYQQPAAQLLGLEPVTKMEKNSWDKDAKPRKVKDWEATLRNYASSGGPNGKLRMVFALFMPHPNHNYTEGFNKAVKKI